MSGGRGHLSYIPAQSIYSQPTPRAVYFIAGQLHSDAVESSLRVASLVTFRRSRVDVVAPPFHFHLPTQLDVH